MKKMKIGILMVLAILTLVSVASAALPFAPVNAVISRNAPVSYYGVDITSGVDPELPVADGYTGWCTDTHTILLLGTNNGFTAYSSLNPASFPASLPTADWNKINYILNNKAADWRVTQAAMWHYNGDAGVPYPEHDTVVGYDHAAYDAYVAQVDEFGANFRPLCGGQIYGVILYKPGTQVVVVERPTPKCPPSPEFPTIALPVAMLVGVVGAVEYLKERK